VLLHGLSIIFPLLFADYGHCPFHTHRSSMRSGS
jgi:hypothetical protein